MLENRIRKVVIVGGGTAGWMTASALAKLLQIKYCDIELVESDDIGIVGVGEATIPQITTYNAMLGLDENAFIRATKATFKLGIEFVNWGKIGQSYLHPFGPYGLDMEGVSFHAFYQKSLLAGHDINLEEYSLQALAAREGKFMRPVNAGNSPLSNIAYAYHFDATLYAKFLRKYSEDKGVKRTEGKVIDVTLRAEDGFVEALIMENGDIIKGDLFIDCTGLAALIIEKKLKVGFVDWSHWLPCNSAVAVPCESKDNFVPHTRSTAHGAGWQWRIPLQHRVGNGHVFSSDYMSEDEATGILMNNLEGQPLAEPKMFHYTAGHRKKWWVKNCVAIGLASGFLEPLESTAIHLIQSGIAKLLAMFPDKGFEQADIDRYNRLAQFEIERVRDFLILHYKATQRDDTDFWNYCRTMDIPPYLQDKMALYESRGRIFRENEELFNDTSWFAVLHGQNIRSRGYDPVADIMTDEECQEKLDKIRSAIRKSVDYMPSQRKFIDENCKA